jgi:hypothetical protein
MSESEKPDAVDRLVHAYELMLERVHTALERAEEATPRLKQVLEQARERAVELNELSREEAEKVANYLERDMQDAAQYIADTGQQLKDWWHFDLDLVENRLLDLFASVADQTSLQLRRFAEQARERSSLYHTGEVTGPGTLICAGCGKPVHFRGAGRIPPCPRCHGTEFGREREGNGETP